MEVVCLILGPTLTSRPCSHMFWVLTSLHLSFLLKIFLLFLFPYNPTYNTIYVVPIYTAIKTKNCTYVGLYGSGCLILGPMLTSGVSTIPTLFSYFILFLCKCSFTSQYFIHHHFFKLEISLSGEVAFTMPC